MKNLFSAADRYVLSCNWRDIAVLKFCLCALGVLVGLVIPARRRKCVVWAAGLVFAATYVPLLAKFLPTLQDEENDE